MRRLSAIFPRIRQRLQPPPVKYFLKLRDQCLMDDTVRSKRFAAVEFKHRSIELRHLAAGFLHDKHAGRRVPGIQIELPEAVVAPACYAAQIERRRPRTPQPMRSQCKLMVKKNVWILVAFMAGKPCGKQTLCQRGSLRYQNRLSIQV